MLITILSFKAILSQKADKNFICKSLLQLKPLIYISKNPLNKLILITVITFYLKCYAQQELKMKVSIVLPVFNGEKFIKDSIESVLNQTFKDFELIIVNDCSTDSTPDIINSYAEKDSRIKIINNKTNLKLPQSLNVGFKNAKGEYYTWTSDDNIYKENAIEYMASFLDKNKNTALVSLGFDVISSDGKFLYSINNNGKNPKQLLYSNNIGACFMYRASIANLVGTYNPDTFLAEDYDYWMRIASKGDIAYINENLYIYRTHEKSLTVTRKNEIIKVAKEVRYKNLYKLAKRLSKNFFQQILLMLQVVYNNLEHKPFYREKNKNKRIVHIFGIKFSYKKKRKAINSPKTYNERLTKEEWGSLYNKNQLENLINSIKNKDYYIQTKDLLNIIPKNSKTLEIGSGTGQTSLALAKKGCNVTLLDYAKECLDLSQAAAKELNLNIKTLCTDAIEDLPFSENEFDYIFHSGLLEHFTKEERISMLKHWRPYCKSMISLVPNASSIAYRVGKQIMEESGNWPYGIETPLYSQVDDFKQAGYSVEKEYTIGVEHSLSFLEKNHPLRIVLENLIQNNKIKDDYMQGYLLVTIGVKKF